MRLKTTLTICLAIWYSGLTQELALVREDKLFGYINKGMNASHGPKIKIVNSIQGVIFTTFFSS